MNKLIRVEWYCAKRGIGEGFDEAGNKVFINALHVNWKKQYIRPHVVTMPKQGMFIEVKTKETENE